MDAITHLLAGACLGRAGLNRKTVLATATVTLAAEAPDLDVLGELKGQIFSFAHNRGFTHSFLGMALVSAVLVGFMYTAWRLWRRKIQDPSSAPRWGWLFTFAYLGGLSHILLDFADNYGVRPYWPFSGKWYSWDIVFVADPIVTLLLLGGLLLPALSNLISEELGPRRKAPYGRLGAILALTSVVTLWGIRNYEHRRAVNALEARQYQGADPIRSSAYAFWWNPFRWSGVVETRSFYATMRVDSSTPEVDPEGEMELRYKPEETPATLAAKNSYLGRVYLDWAKYPITETEPLEMGHEGYIVRLKDLRFEYPGQRRSFPSVNIKLDRGLNVVGMSFGQREP